jgi:hypothetical protein
MPSSGGQRIDLRSKPFDGTTAFTMRFRRWRVIPQRCPLACENHKSDDELRELHFGLATRPTHRIIFVIDPDAVRVLAIRHVAQDDVAPEDLQTGA